MVGLSPEEVDVVLWDHLRAARALAFPALRAARALAFPALRAARALSFPALRAAWALSFPALRAAWALSFPALRAARALAFPALRAARALAFHTEMMHETPEDLHQLQSLLDESRASMGEHMRGILTDDRWLTAEELAALLTGVNVLALATVNEKNEPRVGPVDGLFHRGHWYFGSSPESFRFRHIGEHPAVSGTHFRGEELAVTVHGIAHRINLPEEPAFRQLLVDTYGGTWEDWGAGAAYARIEAHRMYVLHMPPGQ